MLSRKIVTSTLLLTLLAGICVSAKAQTPAAKKKSSSRGTTSGSRTSGLKAGSSKTRGKKASRNSRKKGQQAPTTDRINEIQTALAKNGSFSGEPNGKWDDSTVAAVKKFQSGHGLNPTGRLDAPTLQKLGLGSTTTGIAPPQAPPGAVSRLTFSKLNSAEPSSEDQK